MCNGCDHHHGHASFDIEILPDGTVRVDMGNQAGPHHMTAERFLQFLAQQLGGTHQRTRKAATHTHVANEKRLMR